MRRGGVDEAVKQRHIGIYILPLYIVLASEVLHALGAEGAKIPSHFFQNLAGHHQEPSCDIQHLDEPVHGGLGGADVQVEVDAHLADVLLGSCGNFPLDQRPVDALLGIHGAGNVFVEL
ncbi:hypothetical protein FR483_n573R [Paramecium bursaria Chlorella virus FR483]|uniref:Uncharacterized protein n573R n=1 Tax=Paramecium bursaria Chlorella virus FR483 TaxID=399781 RepID=A7J7S7_PBCVF|nr:hypothetical protein FR483_n573R [Paramecium bursaria Chlorella virus FR483]ABT15858.1 hypothetical protein FR483_n573R [Paramecium bursaria Chlorella virus FR483]